MSTYNVVLFLHVLAAIFGFGVAAVAHSTMFRVRSASSLDEVRGHLRVLGRTGPLFPISAVLLLALGGLLIQLSDTPAKWHWSDGWIVTAVVVLVLAEALGGLVIGRGVTAIEKQLAAAPNGPVDAGTRELLADRPIWFASHVNTATIAAVVLLMTSKPSGLASMLVVLVGAAVGLASAAPFAKPVASPATA